MDQIEETFATRLDRYLADRAQELLQSLTDFVDLETTNEIRGRYHEVNALRDEVGELAQQWIGAEPLLPTTTDGPHHHGYAEHGDDA